MRKSVPLAIALLVLTITGVLGVWGAREVVERTTVTTVLPGTTYVTVTVYGGEGNLVIESPRVFVTMVIERESQVCTVIFRKTQQTASVIAFPGTTILSMTIPRLFFLKATRTSTPNRLAIPSRNSLRFLVSLPPAYLHSTSTTFPSLMHTRSTGLLLAALTTSHPSLSKYSP